MVVTTTLCSRVARVPSEIREVHESLGIYAGWLDGFDVVGSRKRFQVPRQRGHVASLHGHGRSQLILQGKVGTHRIWSLVIKLDSTQGQAVSIDQKWIQRSAGEAGFQSWPPGRSGGGASSKVVDGMSIVGTEEREVELERIVFTNVRRKTPVLESVVEQAKSAASDELGRNLIGESQARGKILRLRVP